MKNTIIKNAHIFCQDRFITGDIMIYDNIIREIGIINLSEIDRSGFDIVKLDNNTVIPAFFDAHTHFYSYALSLNCLNIEECGSIDDIRDSLISFIKENDREVIFGRGWSKSISNKNYPTRFDIDDISGDRIIMLESKDSHSVILNSRALEFCGIGDDTYIENGIIERDSNNRINGLLAENAVKLSKPIYDRLYRLDEKSAIDAVEHASRRLLELGITSIFNVEDIFSTCRILKAIRQGRFYQNLLTTIPEQELNEIDSIPYRKLLRGVKCFMDGALGNLEAAMAEPYLNHENSTGVLTKSYNGLLASIEMSCKEGLPVVVHAIGDKANRTVLDALKESKERKLEYPDRIEHAQLLFPDFISNNYPEDIVFSMQPSHLLTDIKPIRKFWGEDRAKYAFAFNTILGNGNRLIFGTDTPIEKPDPLYGIYAAVKRRDKDNYPETPFMPEQALSPEKALASYTTIPHGIYGEDNAIKIGNSPNFIVYNRHIRFESLKYEDLSDLNVVSVFRPGQ